MILTALMVSVLLWMNLASIYVWACVFVTLGFGAIGFLDDYDKVTKASTRASRRACGCSWSSWSRPSRR